MGQMRILAELASQVASELQGIGEEYEASGSRAETVMTNVQQGWQTTAKDKVNALYQEAEMSYKFARQYIDETCTMLRQLAIYAEQLAMQEEQKNK
ncbi:hypothetical protein P9597_02865 [Aneurinibacillus migulanus]|uniref:hypothetical protein n=1 Tax=Aneurinibacillus migulanus TaxID=47500 RepID=UPI002E1AF19C|nr:hypothetical protein [Aneurinibacillus migulanus]